MGWDAWDAFPHTKNQREWMRVQVEVRASDYAVPKPFYDTVVPTVSPTPVVYATSARIGAAGSGGAATAASVPT